MYLVVSLRGQVKVQSVIHLHWEPMPICVPDTLNIINPRIR